MYLSQVCQKISGFCQLYCLLDLLFTFKNKHCLSSYLSNITAKFVVTCAAFLQLMFRKKIRIAIVLHDCDVQCNAVYVKQNNLASNISLVIVYKL